MAIHNHSEHQFPPSPHSDLFNYLRPEPPVTFNLGVIFMYIIHGCEPKGSDPADRKFLYPLK